MKRQRVPILEPHSLMRIAIIGNSGSGKSTLARQVAGVYAVPTLDLDTVTWEAGKIGVPRDPADASADAKAFCDAHPNWVIEGCYATLIRGALQCSPLLLFLEPGVQACVSNCRRRPWEPHKYKSKREQDEKLELLLCWVREYYFRRGELSLVAHQALFDDYEGPKRKLTRRVEQSFIDDLALLAPGHASLAHSGRPTPRSRTVPWPL